MAASSQESPGLARGVVGSARVIAFEFREEVRLWRHLLIPGAAALLLLFPLWGILLPPAYTLMGCCRSWLWLALRRRRVFMPADR